MRISGALKRLPEEPADSVAFNIKQYAFNHKLLYCTCLITVEASNRWGYTEAF